MEKQELWIKELHEINEEVIHTFGDVAHEKIYLRTNSQSWSIAENLDHLIKVNSSYFPIFQKLEAGTFHGAFIAKIGLFPKLLGNAIYKSVSDGDRKKVKTFPLWEPSANEKAGDIIAEFQKHQQELIHWFREMEPFVQKKVIIHSPVNRLIVYSLEKAFDIIVSHEKRHVDQAKEVLAEINYN